MYLAFRDICRSDSELFLFLLLFLLFSRKAERPRTRFIVSFIGIYHLINLAELLLVVSCFKNNAFMRTHACCTSIQLFHSKFVDIPDCFTDMTTELLPEAYVKRKTVQTNPRYKRTTVVTIKQLHVTLI